MSSLEETPSGPNPKPKKFNTSLTGYSTISTDKTGPYAENLDVDALIVGAGFAGIFMLKTLRDRGLTTVIFEAGNDLGGTWRWNCYPGAGVDSEIPEAYFDHVDKVIGVKKDCAFNTVVVGGQFDTEEGKWIVKTENGRVTRAKYLVLGTGFAAKRYIPPWPGMDKFQGTLHHSSFWPEEQVPVKNKRCAVIGTGASGVQITQAWGPEAGDLKVFQRTPNLAVPMRKRNLTVEEQERSKAFYPELFRYWEANFAGLMYDWCERNPFDHTPEEREAFYESVWKDGGFRYWVALYKDNLFNAEANKESYKFWAKKTRARIGDPHVSGYPNMFHIYGPHGPTPLSNGPTSVAVQGRWIADAITKIEANGVRYIDPKIEAADKWKEHILELNEKTLFPTTRSTYMGGSIPGKVYEPVCYTGGIPAYAIEIRTALDDWERGFNVVKA
ncbi:hypothetical protein BDV12DRAFT_195194 [Aspergillus spectabilis]